MHRSVADFLRARVEARAERDHQASVEAGLAYVDDMRAHRQEAEARSNCKPFASIETSTRKPPRETT